MLANSGFEALGQSVTALTKRTSMRVGYGCVRLLAKAAFIGCFRFRASNAEVVPLHGQVIIAMNHASYLDPPAAAISLQRELYFLAKRELLQKPVLGPFLKYLNAIPVDRRNGGAGLRAIHRKLVCGNAVLIFPESTRGRSDALAKGEPGVGMLTVNSEAVVIPARVRGSWDAWNRHNKLPRLRQVRLIFGPPLDFGSQRHEALTASPDRCKEIERDISAEVMAAIGRL